MFLHHSGSWWSGIDDGSFLDDEYAVEREEGDL